MVRAKTILVALNLMNLHNQKMRIFSAVIIPLLLAACQPVLPVATDQTSSSTSSEEKTQSAASVPSIWNESAAYIKPSDSELRDRLTLVQFDVTQRDGTEPPYRNTYWDNHEEGIYVDIVSGEPLFSSQDKYESGTGWPSFTKPLEPGNIVTHEDDQLLYTRIEVRSRLGDSHLGHVFDDGPEPLGLRYCMNSAALRFIPPDRLEAEGYGQYIDLFPRSTR